MGSWTRIHALALTALLSVGCGGAGEPAAVEGATGAALPDLAPYLSGAPTDIVLRVNGLGITRAEVEAVAAQVAELFPTHVEAHWRREALVYLVLPRAAVVTPFPSAHAAARSAAEAALAKLRAGDELEDEAPEQVEGGWPALSLQLWSAARQLAPGEWSEPVEQVGQIALVRLLERGTLADRAKDEKIVVEVLTFPYLDEGTTAAQLDGYIDAATLVIEDPLYEALVPEAWKYRMRGASS